ncbi:MAG: hypothetical protein D6815_06135, partial [Candidatus Dadabacteria bacterium]
MKTSARQRLIGMHERKRSSVLLLCVVVLAAALRLFHISAQSFWIDEADIYSRAAEPTIAAVI